MQFKPKLHHLWRIALWPGEIQLSVFLKIVWVFCLERVVHGLVNNSFWISLTVFGLFCYCHFVTKSGATCRPKSRYQSDLSTVSVLAKRRLHQDLMHRGGRGTAVPNVGLQAFSLFPLSGSPLDQRPVHRLGYFKALSHGIFGNLIFLYWLWDFNKTGLFDRQNCHLHIATDDSREHQTCVQIYMDDKTWNTSVLQIYLNAISCSVLPIQSCSLWHLVISLLLLHCQAVIR